MMLGAVTAFIIDRNFIWAGGYLVAAAGLTFVGIISAEKVELNANGGATLGYLFGAVVCFALAMMKLPLREKDADELALDAAEGLAPTPAADIVPDDAREPASASSPTP
jgi:AGZA family xanthine/uracil permease-like MFS transporter